MKSSIRSTAQLARTLGLSRWTISRALNGHAGVDPKTVERIQKVARQHGFAPSMLGRGLRRGRTDQVGICLPDLVDYFLTTKISLLQQSLQAGGFHPVLQIIDGTQETESAALERFAAMRCAGVVGIASQVTDSSTGLRCLSSAGIPFVRIDPVDSSHPDSVSTDRAAAMKDALAHFHALGHRQVVVAGFFAKSAYGLQRIKGLRDGCRRLKWNYQRDILFFPFPDADDDFSAGVRLAETYLEKGKNIPAILALNDRVALGLIRTLQTRGLRIPADVSVIGYDNTDFSPYALPPLTTIDPQVDLLIKEAVAMLDASMNSLQTKSVFIKPRLIPRASDGPPPRLN